MSKTTAVTLPPGKESEKDLIFEAADGDNADTILTPIWSFVYPIETNKTRFFRRMAKNFSGDWRKNNPTIGAQSSACLYQSRKVDAFVLILISLLVPIAAPAPRALRG